MSEPNWDKINAKKRKEIMLGQAMNQASRHLTTNGSISLQDDRYKELAKKFFKLNQEIYDEVMKDE